MPSTYSNSLRLELQANGENTTDWGSKTNTNLQLIENSIAGVVSKAMADGNVSLSTANGSTDEARYMTVVLTGANTAARTVTIPAQQKTYIIRNATTGGFHVVVSNGTNSVNVPAASTALIHTDGTSVWHAIGNIYDDQFTVCDPTTSTKKVRIDAGNVTAGNTRVLASPDYDGTIATLAGIEALTNKTLTSPVLNTGVSGTAIADVADYEAFSSTSLLVTPGRMRHHPGVAKASVSWNASGTMGDPYNVGSITDTGVGDWTVNIIDDFSGSDWTGVVTTTYGNRIYAMINTQAAGTSRIIALDTASAFVDPTMMHFIALGDF